MNSLFREFRDAETVQLSGILRWFQGAAAKEAKIQGIPPHYYFYLDEVKVEHHK